MTVLEAGREQTRARYPDEEGYVERDGVRVFWEVYGEGEQTVLLLPTWSLFHSRVWKMQIPYFARHLRVVTFDGRGNGRSDRPEGVEAYTEAQFAADSLAVLDASGTERAIVVGLSCGTLWGTLLAADHPERVAGAIFIGPAVPLAPGHPERAVYSVHNRLDTDEGWAKYNHHYWLEHYEDFLEFFFGEDLHGAALDEGDRGRRRLGPRDPAGAPHRRGAGARALRPGELPGRRASACAAPCSSCTATKTPSGLTRRAPPSPRRPAACSSPSTAPATARRCATLSA